MTHAPRSILLTIAAAMLIATLAAGCASPDLSGEGAAILDAVPEDWSSRTSTTQDRTPTRDEWWTHFDDPELGVLIEEAFAHNPDIRVAAAFVAEASAQLDAAGALRWPELGYSLDANRTRQNFLGIDIPGQDVIQSTTTTFGASLTASWEVDLWGRLSSNEAAAVARYESSVAEAEAALLSISAQVALAWFSLLEADEQYRLSLDIRDRLRATEERIQARFRAGLRPPLDLRLARSERTSIEATVALSDRRRRDARRALELLLGRYPASEVAGRAGLPTLVEGIPVGVPAETLARRPDLRAARARLRATAADRNRSEAELWPQLALFGSGGRLSEELEDLLDGDFSVWSLGASLAGPLFDCGRRHAAVDAAEARRRGVEASFARSVLDACAEVEAALLDEEMLAVQEARLEEFFAEAIATRALAEEQYSLGLAEVLELLSAQLSAARAESRLLEVERARLENRVRLIVALGGSFVPEGVDPAALVNSLAETPSPAPEEGTNP